MSATAPPPDPELIEEFRFVDQVRAHFKSSGVSLAFWEAYCLSQSNRPSLRRALDRASTSSPGEVPELPRDIHESLRLLRDRGGPIVSKLRRLIPSRPRLPEESELLEMALAVLVGSGKGREAVGRWVDQPDLHATEARTKIQDLVDRLDAVHRALRPPEPEPSASAPAEGMELSRKENPSPGTPGVPLPSVSGFSLVAPAEFMMQRPGTPEGVSVTSRPGSVHLTWNPVPGSSGYTVKRSSAAELPFLTIATPNECHYSDEKVTPGSVHRYVVSASNEAGEGSDSPIAEGSASPIAPASPSGLSATPGIAKISLIWNPVPGASEYQVKRGEGPNPRRATLASIRESRFVDVSAKPGITYGYSICAVGPGGVSPESDAAFASPQPPLAAPKGLQASPGNGRILLKWSPVPGATAYVVTRLAGAGNLPPAMSTVSEPAFEDKGIPNGVRCSYVVHAINELGEGEPAEPVGAAPVEPPPAPKGVAASSDDHRIQIKWNAVSGAAYYVVKRRAIAAGPSEIISARLKQTWFEDVPPQRGSKYLYVVSAVGPGGKSPDSLEASAALSALPEAPKGLSAAPGHGSITLTWSPLEGASSYHVKRRIGPGTRFVTLGDPKGPSYVDSTVSGGTRYEYVVTSVSGSLESPDSTGVTAEPLSTPAAPTGLVAQPGDGQVALTWQAVAGASEYRIERSTVREALFVQIARVRGTTSYLDCNVMNGTTYDYVVMAVNSGGRSPTSARARATPAQAPGIPQALQGSSSQGRVLLMWSPPKGATSFMVRRATSPDGPYVELGTTPETTYSDTAVSNGTTYYYRVCAVNAGGQSGDAGPLSATPVDPPAAPANLTASPGPGSITLSWQTSLGATGYAIKRSTENAGPFRTLATVEGIAYVDREVERQTTYYYTVTATNGAGRSPASAMASASPLPSA